MGRHVRLRELLVGVEGLALLRHLYDGRDEDAEQRLVEVRRLLDDERYAAGELTTEADAREGYRAWSDGYDEPGNPIIALEEPVVWGIVDALPPGRALDAACGTGRHTRHLVERGHEVVGVDLSTEMLQRAHKSVPEARFVEADLRGIPLPDEHFDLVVSGLALAHVDELDEAIAELSRLLRPSGHAVLSMLHPFQAHLGWHAPFEDAAGRRGFVREHSHTHANYLTAFRSADLDVRHCVEPTLTISEAQAKRRAFRHIPEATLAAYVDLPGVLVWHVQKRAAA